MAKKKPNLARSTQKKTASKKVAKKATKKTASKKVASKKTAVSVKKESTKSAVKEEIEMCYMSMSDLTLGKNARSDLGDITSLKKSIKVHGVMQSLVVRPKKDKYEVCVGFRRYACASELGLKRVPVIVRTDLEDVVKLTAFQVAENSGDSRTQLSPLDQAKAYKAIMDKNSKLSSAKVGAMCGCSDQHVRLMLRLLDAPTKIQSSLKAGDISTGTAVAVASLENDAVKKKIVSELQPGTTEAQVKARINEIAKDKGVSANPKSKKGNKSTLSLVKSRKEMEAKQDELLLQVLDLRDAKKSTKEIENALAAIFWYFGKIEDIDITASDYKKEFDNLKGLVEEVEE